MDDCQSSATLLADPSSGYDCPPPLEPSIFGSWATSTSDQTIQTLETDSTSVHPDVAQSPNRTISYFYPSREGTSSHRFGMPPFPLRDDLLLQPSETYPGGPGKIDPSHPEDLKEILKKIQHEIPSLPRSERLELKSSLMQTLQKVDASLNIPPTSARETPPHSFLCQFCKKGFSNRGGIKRHLSDQHYPQFLHRCPVKRCPVQYSRKDRLRSHLRSNHDNKSSGDDTTNNDSWMERIELPLPANCPLCHLTTSTWDGFYTCLLSHCCSASDSGSRDSGYSEIQDHQDVQPAILTATRMTNLDLKRKYRPRRPYRVRPTLTKDQGSSYLEMGGNAEPTSERENYQQQQSEPSSLKPESGSERGEIDSDTQEPPAKRPRFDDNRAKNARTKATQESEDGNKSRTALTISQDLSGESQNMDQEIFSVESSMQSQTTKPSQDSFNTSDSEIQQPGELDHLLNPTEFYEKLDDLEFLTAEKLYPTSSSNIRILTDYEVQVISSSGPHDLEVFKQVFEDVLHNVSDTLHHLKSEGFCGNAFSILVEDQSRPQVANIVHISLDDLDRSGINTSVCAAVIFQKVFRSTEKVQASGPLIYKFLENLLPLGLVAYTGSHVCRFDMNIWNKQIEEIPVGLGFSYRSRELACLRNFIGGPAWVLGKSGDQETQAGLKVSMTVQDLQEIWGPVWLVGGTADEAPIIRTERGFIIPLPRAQQISNFEVSGEIDCHWTKTIPDYIEQEDRILLTSNSRILIGTDSAKAGGLTVNLKCGSQIGEIQQHISHQFQFPGTCNDYYTMEGHEVRIDGGHLVPGGIGIRRKRVPGKTHKDRLISTCLNSKIDIWPLMKLQVGLEISACTGNARRITLWDALRLSQTKERTDKPGPCNHGIADPNCMRLCWSRLQLSDKAECAVNGPATKSVAYTNNNFNSHGKETHQETYLTQDEMRQAIVTSLYALEYTGIDVEGNLQACWPFLSTPTNHRIAQTRFNKWLDILADTRDMSTFAVVSQRCLDFREECTRRPWGICPQNYLDSFQRTCLSLRVVPRPISQREKEGPRRLKFGLSTPPDSYLTELSPGSAFRIGKKQLHVKKAWKGQQNVMIAYTSSRFDFSSRWMGVLDFQEQLNPEIKGMEPVDVVICSKTYGETR